MSNLAVMLIFPFDAIRIKGSRRRDPIKKYGTQKQQQEGKWNWRSMGGECTWKHIHNAQAGRGGEGRKGGGVESEVKQIMVSISTLSMEKHVHREIKLI